MELTAEQRYSIWLSSIEGIGSKRVDALLDVFGSAEAVWREANTANTAFLGDKLARAVMDAHHEAYLDDLMARMDRSGAHMIFRGEEAYPPWLENINDPPALLYALGRRELLTGGHCIAMVGARNCSRYGQDAAVMLAGSLAAKGVCIVSGMARGIDSCAHRGALASGGDTIAVLGCGVDIVYPPEFVALHRQIQEEGLLLSEYAPGMPPLPHHFPARNRIISGLAKGLILVEAAKRSGSMITVDFAAEQGREVFAVPGNITSTTSYWPNRLIRDGVRPALDAEDVITYMGWEPQKNPMEQQTVTGKAVTLDMFEHKVVDALSRGDCTLEELEKETQLETSTLNTALTMLELRGIVETLPGRVIALIR